MKQLIITVLAMVFSGCSTLSVDTDYDTAYDFTKSKKYAVVYNAKEGDNTLVNDRITAAIKTNLDKRGYMEVKKESAELVFVFHVQVMQMSDIRTDYETIGFGGFDYGHGWGYRGGGAMVVPHSTTYRWTEGQLVIDAYNPKTEKIVWRGLVKDEISEGSHTPQEKTEYINKVVTKLLGKFPPKVRD